MLKREQREEAERQRRGMATTTVKVSTSLCPSGLGSGPDGHKDVLTLTVVVAIPLRWRSASSRCSRLSRSGRPRRPNGEPTCRLRRRRKLRLASLSPATTRSVDHGPHTVDFVAKSGEGVLQILHFGS
jgi:hypothetical protein